jgi:hypothetical protein
MPSQAHNPKASKVNQASRLDVFYSFAQMVGAFLLMMLGLAATAFAGLWLVAYKVTPLNIQHTTFATDGFAYEMNNTSNKTVIGEMFCDNPSNRGRDPESVIIFEDVEGHREVVPDNATGIGTGTTRTRTWRSSGQIPRGLKAGEITVWKSVRYQCFAGIVDRDVESRQFKFFLTNPDITTP